MSQILVDEREHRRGLVLGLTLAEVLLLLLFLLLLTLAAKLNEITADKETVLKELDESRIALEKLRPLETGSIGAKELAKRLTSFEELEARNAELERANLKFSDLMKSLKADPAKLASASAAIQDAAKIDPTDPPAVLIRALDVLQKLGPDISPEQLTSLIKAKAEGQAKSATSKGVHNWPPIISLSEADGYFFQIGSAELSPEFKSTLTGSVIAKLLETIKQYDVNVIEVIGHTDEQRIAERASNLDKTLIPYLQQKGVAERFIPADNAGLGLARAVSVVQILGTDPRLANLRILPLSGAQLIDVGDKLADGASGGDVKERRRIEIRVRRSDKERIADSQSWVAKTQINELEQPAVGRAVVIDGDTIDIAGKRIRLWGVDAIESAQTCTKQGRTWDCATDVSLALKGYLEGQTVTCSPKNRDAFDRIVATCIARNRDLGAWLVRQGHALDYVRYSGGAYRADQAAATAEKQGIWQGEFIPPWVWRQLRKQ